VAETSPTEAASVYESARALLIDLDGTLIDSTAPVDRAWTAFAQRHGLVPEEVIRFAQGRPGRETVRLLIPDGDYVAEAAIIEYAEVNDTDGVTALPGALSILTSGRTLAIVTSCSLNLLRSRLAAAGLPEPAIKVTSDDITHGKPDPECFVLGAERLGVPSAECVVLEDAPAGIAAGKGSGATVIAMVSTHAAEDLTEADWVVDDLTVLLRVE
jgi:sugar-phosphatase